jgi:hypothetical protein
MRIRDGFVLQPFGDQWVAVELAEGKEQSALVTLNKTGVFLWELFTRETTTQEAVNAMTERYQVDEAMAQRDVEQFLKIAECYGLLEK